MGASSSAESKPDETVTQKASMGASSSAESKPDETVTPVTPTEQQTSTLDSSPSTEDKELASIEIVFILIGSLTTEIKLLYNMTTNNIYKETYQIKETSDLCQELKTLFSNKTELSLKMFKNFCKNNQPTGWNWGGISLYNIIGVQLLPSDNEVPLYRFLVNACGEWEKLIKEKIVLNNTVKTNKEQDSNRTSVYFASVFDKTWRSKNPDYVPKDTDFEQQIIQLLKDYYLFQLAAINTAYPVSDRNTTLQKAKVAALGVSALGLLYAAGKSTSGKNLINAGGNKLEKLVSNRYNELKRSVLRITANMNSGATEASKIKSGNQRVAFLKEIIKTTSSALSDAVKRTEDTNTQNARYDNTLPQIEF
jgi:hypothetical protein